MKKSDFYFIGVFTVLVLVFSSYTPYLQKSFVEKLEQAHKKEVFVGQEAISFDLNLSFNGKQRLLGKLTLLTNSTKGLIELKSGDKIIYRDGEVFWTGDFSEKRARFDAYTWSYFFMLPYKLSDEGTIWSEYSNSDLNGKKYETQKLSFESGTGDAPDDWYVIYADPSSSLINTAAYIVTAGMSKEKAEEDPHAISYRNYKMIKGVPIAHSWTFWEWRENKGLTKQLGEAEISSVEFITATDELFKL